jgi:hypothetical protein
VSPKAAKSEGFRNRIVGLEVVPASELAQHPQNWRLHPERQRSAMLSALETIGIADAVLAYRSERADGALTLIDGHLRRDLIDKVPVLVTDLSDDEADMLLASHDVITTMAQRDESALAALLEGIEAEMPRDLMMAIDPDYEGVEAAEGDNEGGKARYPIVPEFDEGYDCLIVFSSRESDWNWLVGELELPVAEDRSKIGISHVLTVDQFRTWLSTRSS